MINIDALEWHPSCCAIVLRSIPTSTFGKAVAEFPSISKIQESLSPMGLDAWQYMTK